MPKATLVLKDGTKLTGDLFGADTYSAGEVVFNTGMTGYPESFTDPSYEGQILVLTYPLIGNYGVPSNEKDENALLKFFESDRIHVRGVIVNEYSENYSHWNGKKSLHEWLKENNIPMISGIDTRTLTKRLRTHGVMLGKIIPESKSTTKTIKTQSDDPAHSTKQTQSDDPVHSDEPTQSDEFPDPNIENLVDMVSIKKPILYKSENPKAKKIICVDCGMKLNILRSLLARGLTVLRVPWDYDFTKHFKYAVQQDTDPQNHDTPYDGLFLSNGPGDPAILYPLHDHIRQAMKMKNAHNKPIPIFGICLGNQVLAIASGAKTYKLKFGHRAQNQPVQDIDPNSDTYNQCFITSQNHGFAVDEKTLPPSWKVWLKNLNDNTNEGIAHSTLPYFSCQFHPEATPGPVDADKFFDKFVELL